MVARQIVPIGGIPSAVLEPVCDDADDLACRVAMVRGEGFEAVGYVTDGVACVADSLFGIGRWGRCIGHCVVGGKSFCLFFYFFLKGWFSCLLDVGEVTRCN